MSTQKSFLATLFSKQVFIPILVVGVLLLVWLVPSADYTFTDLTVVQQRVLIIFIFAVIMWVTEYIPSWITSVSLTTLLLFTVSDSALSFCRINVPQEDLLSYRSLIATFADPIIFLFLGGFILAAVASKFSIDKKIANGVINLIGKTSKYYLLGIMLVTALCSMFVSNTATAIMMLTLISPLLNQFDKSDKGRTAMVLGIAVAANLGGMGTPIGTPPNAIVLKYLNDPSGLNMDISFGEWTMVFAPFALLMIVIVWRLLLYLFPFSTKELNKMDSEPETDMYADTPHLKYFVYSIIAATIILWCFDRIFGVNPNVVAFIPIALFCLLGVFGKKDLANIDWSVLWLVAGGFSLGFAFQESGLALKLITSINFSAIHPWIILISCWLICYLLSNFISNTATVNLLTPIFVALATSLSSELQHLGGARTLLVGVAVFASLAMILPVSTPPQCLGLLSRRT